MISKHFTKWPRTFCFVGCIGWTVVFLFIVGTFIDSPDDEITAGAMRYHLNQTMP